MLWLKEHVKAGGKMIYFSNIYNKNNKAYYVSNTKENQLSNNLRKYHLILALLTTHLKLYFFI